ncbi:uncharacterized protein LOC142464669 isoform X1 [Ascaphus truei]|uniref:uncharacterized protein LOC142464669 isoform X1 n=1 Tax=Ascaphus truei TaxID=8439 RepID=UPI003F598844
MQSSASPRGEEQNPPTHSFVHCKEVRGSKLVVLLWDAAVTKTNLEMKSNCGVEVLLMTAIASAFGIWFLSIYSATTDTFLSLAGGPEIRPTALAESGENSTYGKYQRESVDLETSFAELTTLLKVQYFVPGTEYPFPNSTLIETNPQPTVTQNIGTLSTKQSLSTSWTDGDLAAVNSSVEANTGKEVTWTTLSNQYTDTSQNITPTEDPSLSTDSITAMMEGNRTVCIRDTGPSEPEILAIVVGGVFLATLICALSYQLVVFMRKKNVKRHSSVYIIENDILKYDLEANGIQPETKL